MDLSSFFQQFQGITTLFSSDITVSITRVFLILLGLFLMYLGKKGVLEALLMVPMGLGMATVNASLMIMPAGIPGGYADHGAVQGTLFLDSMVTDVNQLFDLLQIDFLQPIYVFTFSNGLIACLVFMGIGSLLDIGYLLQRPFVSMLLALCAELGTFVTVPIAQAMGLTAKEAASIAMVGGADGPMVLFTSLSLAKHLFVPITVVAYLYLGLTYGGYPYLIRLLIPKKLRAIKIDKSNEKPAKNISSSTKLAAAAVMCVILCLLFPVASPLFFSLFLGISVKEAGLTHIYNFISGPLLYGSTFFLGLTLGVLCEAHLLLDPRVLKLLILGILALLFSGIGGIMGGYIMYFIKKGNFNPTIGIAGVSCVPSTAKVAQKEVSKANPMSMILPEALGANICGVITSAIIAGLYINFFG
jgi:carboxybiotin decarboxylase